MALADMAGSLFVADVELAGRVARKLDDRRRPTFLDLPFDQAVEFFEARFQDPDRALEVIRAYRDRATGASQRTLEQIAQAMITKLNRTLERGDTLQDFILEFRGDRERLEPGTTTDNPEINDALQARFRGYLENVYRTNIQTAYGAGRIKEIEAVADSIPYVEYVTAGDDRVRQSHRDLDGKVWKTSDPEWKRFAPPNGYQCRCSLVTREASDFQPSQLTRRATSEGIEPDFLRPPTDLINDPL